MNSTVVEVSSIVAEGTFAIGLAMVLGVVAVIDARRQVIPNIAVGLLLLGGLAQSNMLKFVPLHDAVAGAIAGGFLFYVVQKTYKSMRGINGLGSGDVKFMVAAGSWVGLMGLPILVLLASVSALLMISALQLAIGGMTQQTRIAFGPHLSVALLATWLARIWGYI
jgi:leader peptidase (prepilin peptidase) / N-methyltransferase